MEMRTSAVLSPRAQDGEEADFSSQVPGVGGNLEHGLSGGAEEKIGKPLAGAAGRAVLAGGAR